MICLNFNKEEVNKYEDNKKVNEVKLKSAMYNHDNEKIDRRDENSNDAVMWGVVIGFALFFVILIIIICCVL